MVHQLIKAADIVKVGMWLDYVLYIENDSDGLAAIESRVLECADAALRLDGHIISGGDCTAMFAKPLGLIL